MSPIQNFSAPKCHCLEWLGSSNYRYKDGAGFQEWRNRAHDTYSKVNYDFLNNYLYVYVYLAIRHILLSGIICILLSGKFYYPKLSVSGYPDNFTIRASLHKRQVRPLVKLIKDANLSLKIQVINSKECGLDISNDWPGFTDENNIISPRLTSLLQQ